MMQVPDVQQFLVHYNMQCPMAAKRLIQSGMPATMEHGKPRCGFDCYKQLPSACRQAYVCLTAGQMPQHVSGGYRRYSQGSHSAVNIAGSVQAFITTMDSLKLNMAAVDQVWQNLVAAAEGFHTIFI